MLQDTSASVNGRPDILESCQLKRSALIILTGYEFNDVKWCEVGVDSEVHVDHRSG